MSARRAAEAGARQAADATRQAEATAAVLREEVLARERRCAALEVRLQEAESAHRAERGQGGGNLAYLKQVVERYIAMGDGAESDALFQVIATFLQFDAGTVQELQRARQRRATAQQGIQGRLSLLF